MQPLRRRSALTPVLIALCGCAAQTNTAAIRAADEAAILAADQRLLAAAGSHDAEAFAAEFAADGELLFPNRPKARGREAIRETVAADFALPGFNVSWEQSKLMVSQAGDLAVSIGSYHLRLSLAEGPIDDRGKYMTVWRKIDGQWRVAADMINTDAPHPGM
jgi:uncharacterized protein (TIGR02246 family)